MILIMWHLFTLSPVRPFPFIFTTQCKQSIVDQSAEIAPSGDHKTHREMSVISSCVMATLIDEQSDDFPLTQHVQY